MYWLFSVYTVSGIAEVCEGSVFCDRILCSLLKVNQHFRGKYRLHLEGELAKQETSMRAGGNQTFVLVSDLVYFTTLNMDATCSSKMPVDF
jgi:hypothetical protein